MYNPFKKTYTEDEQKKIDYLSKIYLFENLTNEEVANFIPYLYERRYKENEIVFFRKDPSQALYILRSGRVQINVDVQEAIEKLVYLDPGAAFGESCLMKNKFRGANAMVVSDDASFYVIPQVNFFDIFDRHVEIKAKMMETLAIFYSEIHSNIINSYRSTSGFFHLADLYSD